MSTLTLSPPARSVEQRRLALELANQVRCRRAALKIEMKRRQADPLRVLLAPEREIETMKVYELLLAVPGIGQVKASAMLRRTGVSPSKTIAGLSIRQRDALAGELRLQLSGRGGWR